MSIEAWDPLPMLFSYLYTSSSFGLQIIQTYLESSVKSTMSSSVVNMNSKPPPLSSLAAGLDGGGGGTRGGGGGGTQESVPSNSIAAEPLLRWM